MSIAIMGPDGIRDKCNHIWSEIKLGLTPEWYHFRFEGNDRLQMTAKCDCLKCGSTAFIEHTIEGDAMTALKFSIAATRERVLGQ
mgnify:FL=1